MLRFWLYADSYITHLKNEVEWYRAQLVHERTRAEMATDELLRLRVAAGPVSPPALPSATERQVEALLRDPEFVSAGSAE